MVSAQHNALLTLYYTTIYKKSHNIDFTTLPDSILGVGVVSITGNGGALASGATIPFSSGIMGSSRTLSMTTDQDAIKLELGTIKVDLTKFKKRPKFIEVNINVGFNVQANNSGIYFNGFESLPAEATYAPTGSSLYTANVAYSTAIGIAYIDVRNVTANTPFFINPKFTGYTNNININQGGPKGGLMIKVYG